MSAITCKNCGHTAHGAYCQTCGQATRVGRLQLSDMAGQIWDAVVDWDGRLWGTLRGLSTQPGRVCTEYVEGRRQAYVPPLRFCLLALLANLVIGQFITMELPLTASPDFSSEQQQAFLMIFQEFRRLAVAHSDWIALVCVPFIALLYRVLMWGRGRNYAECGAMVLYLSGHVGAVSALLSPVKWAGPMPAALLRLLVFFLLYVAAARPFFKVGFVRAAVSALVAALLTFVISFLTLLVMAWAQGTLQPVLDAMKSAA